MGSRRYLGRRPVDIDRIFKCNRHDGSWIVRRSLQLLLHRHALHLHLTLRCVLHHLLSRKLLLVCEGGRTGRGGQGGGVWLSAIRLNVPRDAAGKLAVRVRRSAGNAAGLRILTTAHPERGHCEKQEPPMALHVLQHLFFG